MLRIIVTNDQIRPITQGNYIFEPKESKDLGIYSESKMLFIRTLIKSGLHVALVDFVEDTDEPVIEVPTITLPSQNVNTYIDQIQTIIVNSESNVINFPEDAFVPTSEETIITPFISHDFSESVIAPSDEVVVTSSSETETIAVVNSVVEAEEEIKPVSRRGRPRKVVECEVTKEETNSSEEA